MKSGRRIEEWVGRGFKSSPNRHSCFLPLFLSLCLFFFVSPLPTLCLCCSLSLSPPLSCMEQCLILQLIRHSLLLTPQLTHTPPPPPQFLTSLCSSAYWYFCVHCCLFFLAFLAPFPPLCSSLLILNPPWWTDNRPCRPETMGACLCKGHKGQCPTPPACSSSSVCMSEGLISLEDNVTAFTGCFRKLHYACEDVENHGKWLIFDFGRYSWSSNSRKTTWITFWGMFTMHSIMRIQKL